MAKQAFVISRSDLVAARIIPANTASQAMYVPFTSNNDLEILLKLANDKGSYRERGGNNDVEKDASVQQLIVYGYIVLSDGRFMLYQRGTVGYSESRLAGKVSLGLGGHMDQTDLTLMGAFYRELDEETLITAGGKTIHFRKENGSTDVRLMQRYVRVEPRGVIKDERDEVGKVHLGVACRVAPLREDITIAVRADTDENVRSFFVTPAEYESMVTSGEINLEGWTDIVYRNELQARA